MLKTLSCSLCFCVMAAAQQPAGPGARAFAERCATCHGLDAKGSEQAPSLLNYVRSHTAGEVATIVRNGVPGKAAMPAFHLPDSELREIVAHVRFIAGATSSASAEIGAVSSGEFTAVVSPPRDPTTGLQFIPEKWKGGSVSQPSRLALRIQDYLTMPM